jgi:cell division protein FtsQ
VKGNRKGPAAPPAKRAHGKVSKKAPVAKKASRREPEISDSSSRPNKRRPKPFEKAPRAPRVPLRERFERVRTISAGAWERVRRPVWLVARIVLVVVVAAGAVAVGRLVEKHVRTSPAFATKHVNVEGAERLTEEEILEAAGLAVDQNVFDLAPEDAQARLVAHPWIADATVRRKLPDTFEVTIREHEAVAVLALTEGGDEGDSLYLVAEDASVFKRVTEDDPLDLPVVTGVDRTRFSRDRSWRSSLLVEIVALLHDYRGAGLWRREPIAELHLEEDDSLSMYIGDDAARIALGHGPFRGKLRRLRRVLDELRSREARPAYVYLDNVRRPDRVTVRLR